MNSSDQRLKSHPTQSASETDYVENRSSRSVPGATESTRPAVTESASFPYSALFENDRRRPQALTAHEITKLRQLLNAVPVEGGDIGSLAAASVDSDYPVFGESTHAWAIFADNPKKRAGTLDRAVGLLIILFQLFTYWMFAAEAIEDYQSGQVAVTTSHGDCLAANEAPDQNLQCEAGFTNGFDAFVAFFMLGIFLAGDFIQAFKVIRLANSGTPLVFACLATIEVISAYLSASISVSYNLYIGEVTDAVEVGVGLLFIRELSQRAYVGIRDGEAKQYKVFFVVLAILVSFGMLMDPLCERLFASKLTSA